MTRYQLDTDNAGCDEILEGDSIDEVTQDVLYRYEVDELPDGWTVSEIELQFEMAEKLHDGAWHSIGEYKTIEEAIADAKQLACQAYRDDFGTVVFGITADPDGGSYETAIKIYKDGTSIREDEGVIVGEV